MPGLNLIYHLTPMGDWRRHLAILDHHKELFKNGIIAIAISNSSSIVNEFIIAERRIKATIPHVITIEVVNDPDKRESISFPSLLQIVKAAGDKNSYTLFAHSKGVTRGEDEACRLWTDALYYLNFERALDNAKLLQNYPIVGSLKRYGLFKNFPNYRDHRWHYSGTFFWFRNDKMFWEREENIIPIKHRYGVECFPAQIYRIDQGGCLFGERARGFYKLIHARTMANKIDKELSKHADFLSFKNYQAMIKKFDGPVVQEILSRREKRPSRGLSRKKAA